MCNFASLGVIHESIQMYIYTYIYISQDFCDMFKQVHEETHVLDVSTSLYIYIYISVHAYVYIYTLHVCIYVYVY